MKNTLKKIAMVVLGLSGLVPVVSFAQSAPALPIVDLTYSGITGKINYVANVVFAILIMVTIFFLLWAAWKYLTGKGDDAKAQILNAAIAIAIGLLARGLPFLVEALVGSGYQVNQVIK